VSKVTKCRECGGSNLYWSQCNSNKTGIAEGRLRTHEVTCSFVLGCEDCSETMAVIGADAFIARFVAAQAEPAALREELAHFKDGSQHLLKSLAAAEQRNAELLEILRSLRLNASPQLFSAGQLALVDAALVAESAVVEIDERAEFEAERLRQNPQADLKRNPSDNYMNFYLECAWNGRQQRAALKPTQEGASE